MAGCRYPPERLIHPRAKYAVTKTPDLSGVFYFTVALIASYCINRPIQTAPLSKRIEVVEEVIEELREKNEPVPVPLELPDEDLLVEIEEQLFIDIPFVFKEFLLTVSDVVYGSLEPVTVTDPQSHTYLPEVAANAWDAGVPRELIPICQSGDDYYCVEEDGTVVLWSAEEELVTEETWESVWHWARDVWLES
jgi:hypothetical protein